VIFPTSRQDKETTGKAILTQCVEAMRVNGTWRAILVAQFDLTSFAKRYINEVEKEFKLEVFKVFSHYKFNVHQTSVKLISRLYDYIIQSTFSISNKNEKF
jgi:hypothetical protein